MVYLEALAEVQETIHLEDLALVELEHLVRALLAETVFTKLQTTVEVAEVELEVQVQMELPASEEMVGLEHLPIHLGELPLDMVSLLAVFVGLLAEVEAETMVLQVVLTVLEVSVAVELELGQAQETVA
jgi:hypothetical protein